MKIVGRCFIAWAVAVLGACAQGTSIEPTGENTGGRGGEGEGAGTTAATGGSGGEGASSGGAGGNGGTTSAGGANTGGAGGQGGSAPACGDGALDPGEECDGPTDFPCADLGFSGGNVTCTDSCTFNLAACDGCGDGFIQQALGEDCDFDSQGDPLVAATCQSLGFPMSAANPGCQRDCKFDLRPCKCGNDMIDEDEPCDGANMNGNTCLTEGFGGGMIACTPDCTLDTSGCSLCQNGMLDPGELCDGANMGGHTCQTEGFGSGAISCTPMCTLNTSLCNPCGNGMLNAGEGCDDGNTASGDGCSATCQPEMMACDPDGTYTIVGGSVAYTCCFGLVSVNVNSFLFSSNGATIGSSPSNPVSMTGAPTTCPVGSFNNTGTIPGGCAETYHLTGSYTSADTWTGTYEILFSGPDCSCFGGLGTPCVNQLFSITAQR